MESIASVRHVLITVLLSFFLVSCSKVGLVDESTLPVTIDSVGVFFKVFFLLQFSILLVSIVLSIFLSRLGYLIALILHFILVVNYRDYGFLNVLLLFSLFSIVSFVINIGISMLGVFKKQ